MNPDPQPSKPSETSANPRGKRILRLLVLLLLIWGATAYLVLPWIEKHYFEHEDKHDGSSFATVARVTRTGDDHPGDPINLALVGEDAQLVHGMTAAGWYPADPITFDSSMRIAVDSVFRRPDDRAPVSNLFLYGKKQDLAFEEPIGDSPRRRHHVRFWSHVDAEEKATVWFGSATLDERVGLSYATGQITHHIGPDVDAERDRIVGELRSKGWVKEVRWIDGFHEVKEGRNGGGDLWTTDGRLAVVVLQDGPAGPGPSGPGPASPATAAPPPPPADPKP
jgi:hypothetical protein